MANGMEDHDVVQETTQLFRELTSDTGQLSVRSVSARVEVLSKRFKAGGKTEGKCIRNNENNHLIKAVCEFHRLIFFTSMVSQVHILSRSSIFGTASKNVQGMSPYLVFGLESQKISSLRWLRCVRTIILWKLPVSTNYPTFFRSDIDNILARPWRVPTNLGIPCSRAILLRNYEKEACFSGSIYPLRK